MKKTPKNAKIFLCDSCDFKCSKQSDYDRHLLTLKHQNRTILNEKTPKNAEFVCECGKKYKVRNSLWYHKQKCTTKNVIAVIDNNTPSEPTLEYLLKENLGNEAR